jgi:hypothetical protein
MAQLVVGAPISPVKHYSDGQAVSSYRLTSATPAQPTHKRVGTVVARRSVDAGRRGHVENTGGRNLRPGDLGRAWLLYDDGSEKLYEIGAHDVPNNQDTKGIRIGPHTFVGVVDNDGSDRGAYGYENTSNTDYTLLWSGFPQIDNDIDVIFVASDSGTIDAKLKVNGQLKPYPFGWNDIDQGGDTALYTNATTIAMAVDITGSTTAMWSGTAPKRARASPIFRAIATTTPISSSSAARRAGPARAR